MSSLQWELYVDVIAPALNLDIEYTRTGLSLLLCDDDILDNDNTTVRLQCKLVGNVVLELNSLVTLQQEPESKSVLTITCRILLRISVRHLKVFNLPPSPREGDRVSGGRSSFPKKEQN